MIGHHDEAVNRPKPPPLRMKLANHPRKCRRQLIGNQIPHPPLRIARRLLFLRNLAKRPQPLHPLQRHHVEIGFRVIEPLQPLHGGFRQFFSWCLRWHNLPHHPSAVNGRPIGHSRSRPIGHSQLPIPHLAQRLGLVSELKRHGGKLGLLVFGKHKRLTSRNLKVDQ